MTAKRGAARARAEELRREQEARSRRRRTTVVAVTAVLLVGIFVAVVIAWQSADRRAALNARGPDGLSERGGIVVGQESAPVTVTVITDFMCPACRAFEEADAELLAELVADGRIKVEYLPVSLLDGYSEGSKFSTRAAGAAYCVAGTDPERYVEFHDEMFVNQPAEGTSGMSSEQIAAVAARAGVSMAGQECITEDTYAGFATRVTDELATSGWQPRTPTVLVQDQPVPDWSPEALLAAVDAAG